MGGWIALLLAETARDSGRVAGLVLIAPAYDMTRALMWDRWSKAARRELTAIGVHLQPSDYSDEPYPITRALIEDGDRHLFGDRLIETGCPVPFSRASPTPTCRGATRRTSSRTSPPTTWC